MSITIIIGQQIKLKKIHEFLSLRVNHKFLRTFAKPGNCDANNYLKKQRGVLMDLNIGSMPLAVKIADVIILVHQEQIRNLSVQLITSVSWM
jgi:hypothetical protein